MQPTLLHIGDLAIKSYPVLILSAILIGSSLTVWRAHRLGERKAEIFDYLLVTAIGATLGARLFYVLLERPQYFMQNPLSVFTFWSGGLVLYGGIIGALVAGWLFCWRCNVGIGKLLDFGAAPLALSVAIGRIGCFLSGCCVGAKCELSWPLAIVYPYNEGLPLEAQHYPDALLATPILSALFNLALFYLLLRLRRWKRFHGQLFCWYLLLYSIGRFLLDFSRETTSRGDYLWDMLSKSQVYALMMIALALAILALRSTKGIVDK